MEDLTKKLIGTRINTALAAANLKQKDLAKELDVTDNTVSYWCNGTRTPNTDQIIQIARVLNISSDYLLGLSENPTTNKDEDMICTCTGLDYETFEILRSKVDSMNYYKNESKNIGIYHDPYDDYDYYEGADCAAQIEVLNYLLQNDFFYECLLSLNAEKTALNLIINQQKYLLLAANSKPAPDHDYFIKQTLSTIQNHKKNARYAHLDCIETFRDAITGFAKEENEKVEANNDAILDALDKYHSKEGDSECPQ